MNSNQCLVENLWSNKLMRMLNSPTLLNHPTFNMETSTGETAVLSLVSKIKDNAVHAGHSQQLVPLKVDTSWDMVLFSHSQNNNLSIASQTMEVAMVVLLKMPSPTPKETTSSKKVTTHTELPAMAAHTTDKEVLLVPLDTTDSLLTETNSTLPSKTVPFPSWSKPTKLSSKATEVESSTQAHAEPN